MTRSDDLHSAAQAQPIRGTIEWSRRFFGGVYEEEPPRCSAPPMPSGSMQQRPAPFKLPDDGGTMRRLSQLQDDTAMILILWRGEHCPREHQHQREMVRSHQWCTVAFTELVTVLPNHLHDTNKMRIATGAYWPLPDRCRPPRAAQPADRGAYRPHHHAIVPRTLVLVPGLVIDKVYVGYWFWDGPRRSSSGRTAGPVAAHQGGLRPDPARGVRGMEEGQRGRTGVPPERPDDSNQALQRPR
jgi:hypothetical protein